MENPKIKLSIVIAAWNNVSSLRQCLESLETQTDKAETEIIAVSNFPIDFKPDEFSMPIKFIALSETAIVPELRREGIEAASGGIVALLEDHCVFDSRWVEEIRLAHKKSVSVVGGAVENAGGENALDWAVYFYDYGKFMPPNRKGAADSLSGINVSYKRNVLNEIQEIYREGFYETFVNEELKKRGHSLMMMPSAIVYHNKNYQISRASEHCYHLARAFAARRVADFTLLKRSTFTVLSLILPILLPARIVSATLKKGRRQKQLFRSFPFLLWLMSVWSFGEFCGYLRGAGNSAGKWR